MRSCRDPQIQALADDLSAVRALPVHELPVDHVNVIDGYFTRWRTRVRSPFVV
jgi:hypothetical protein